MLSIFYLCIQLYESVNYQNVKYYPIYQILTKTDYLQGRNFHGKFDFAYGEIVFLFAQV